MQDKESALSVHSSLSALIIRTIYKAPVSFTIGAGCWPTVWRTCFTETPRERPYTGKGSLSCLTQGSTNPTLCDIHTVNDHSRYSTSTLSMFWNREVPEGSCTTHVQGMARSSNWLSCCAAQHSAACAACKYTSLQQRAAEPSLSFPHQGGRM